MNNSLRKLARSRYWQAVYSQSKELGSMQLFTNNKDFTYLQVIFLSWISIYSTLYQDITNKEKYINEKIINNDIRCDAYLTYRKTKDDKKEKKHQDGSLVFVGKK